MQTTDKKMFLDMQEHPEKYSDQQIEVMQDELDRVPDVKSAWQKFSAEHNERTGSAQNHPTHISLHPSFLKIAAVFLAVAFLGGLAFAAFRIFSPTKEQQKTEFVTLNPQPTTLNYSPDGLVLFADIRLDSMLSIVSMHYSKAVSFGNEELKGLRIHTKWNQEDSLATFIESLNELEGLQLKEQRDTIFVQKGGVQ